MRREPRDFEVELVGGEEWCPTAATEANQHARLCKFPHCSLGDRGPGAKQDGRRVGDRDVPVKGAIAFVGDVLNPATVYQYSTMFQVVQVRALRVQDGLEVGRGEVGHSRSALVMSTRIAFLESI